LTHPRVITAALLLGGAAARFPMLNDVRHLNATSTRVRRFCAAGAVETRRESASIGKKFRDYKLLGRKCLISLPPESRGGMGS